MYAQTGALNIVGGLVAGGLVCIVIGLLGVIGYPLQVRLVEFLRKNRVSGWYLNLFLRSAPYGTDKRWRRNIVLATIVILLGIVLIIVGLFRLQDVKACGVF